MDRRKKSTRCCTRAPVNIEVVGLHCSFCQIQLCPNHEVDAEVAGHVFTACQNCQESLASRRPGIHESCICHDIRAGDCDTHREIEGIG